MRQLLELVRKEWLVLTRDWHALLLLFVMPASFILIMSIALRDRFAEHSRVEIGYLLEDLDLSPFSAAVTARLAGVPEFKRLDLGTHPDAEAALRADQVHFLLRLPKGFAKDLKAKAPQAIEVLAAPGVEPALYKLFNAALREAVGRAFNDAEVAALKKRLPAGAATEIKFDVEKADALVRQRSVLDEGGAERLPSSVQQNVPAWLVFAMFFIAIPLSTTWVQEKQQGTFARLRSMGVARHWLLAGKFFPYFAINLLQVALMLAVGVWLVPACGGERLDLGNAPGALALMAVALSFASVSFALLIANLVSTSEQATIFTAVSNLILAAVGGIMVPRFIMPPAMQELSLHTPLAWGLEGFLDVFLRQGGLAEVGGEAMKLAAFGLAALALAGLRLGRQSPK